MRTAVACLLFQNLKDELSLEGNDIKFVSNLATLIHPQHLKAKISEKLWLVCISGKGTVQMADE